MTHGITKETVRTTVASLNDKAERLGWTRRYEVQFGSNPNGVKHVLQTRVPQLDHPTDLHPFATLSQVHKYLLAMGQVLNDALLERQRERVVVMTGASARPVATYDPDSRTARRAAEDQADYFNRPAGADQ